MISLCYLFDEARGRSEKYQISKAGLRAGRLAREFEMWSPATFAGCADQEDER